MQRTPRDILSIQWALRGALGLAIASVLFGGQIQPRFFHSAVACDCRAANHPIDARSSGWSADNLSVVLLSLMSLMILAGHLDY
jgi:hypothetical protein